MGYVYGTEEWENAYREMAKERLAGVEKPYFLGTPEWVADFEKKIQEDEHYKKVAETWEGTVVIHILANPDIGLDEDIYVLMDLWHGDCRSIRLVPGEAGERGDYVLSGPFERWQQVMNKELDVTKAMMQGKIKLNGSLPEIVRYVKASIRLVELASQIETRFLNEAGEEEQAEFKRWFNELRAEFGF